MSTCTCTHTHVACACASDIATLDYGASRDGRPPPKKVENLKKKIEEAAPPSVADAEEPVEPGGTTTETFKPEARATSEL
eukprot:7385000-Prymnesium_polylepis.1